jgi:hypothetical protein
MKEQKDSDTSIRVITFSGKKVDWVAWEEKFLANFTRYGCHDVLLGTWGGGMEIPRSNETLNKTDEDYPSQMKLQELNLKAYTALALSMDMSTIAGKVAFNLVRLTKTSDYSYGNAAHAWSKLKRKYAPEMAPTLHDILGRYLYQT